MLWLITVNKAGYKTVYILWYQFLKYMYMDKTIRYIKILTKFPSLGGNDTDDINFLFSSLFSKTILNIFFLNNFRFIKRVYVERI